MNELAQYAYDNAEPAFTETLFIDAVGGRYGGDRAEATAIATNTIMLLVGDFIEKKGIFSPEEIGDLNITDVYEGISEIMQQFSKE